MALTGALLIARSARADVPPIEWYAPPGCGNAADLSMGVARLLRAKTSDVIHERFVARVVEEAAGRYRLSLQGITRNASWTRSITGASCFELHDATKVMIALAIAPSRAEAIVGPSGATVPSTARAADEPRSAAPSEVTLMPPGDRSGGSSNGSALTTTAARVSAAAVAPEAPASTAVPNTPRDSESSRLEANASSTRRADVTAPRTTKPATSSAASLPDRATAPSTLVPPTSGTALFVRAGVVAGVLPKLTPMLALGATHGIGHLQLVGYVGWMLDQSARSPVDPNQGARIQLGFASTEVGFAWLEGPMELGLHASLQGGVMIAKGSGVRNDQPGTGPFGAVGSGFSLALPAESAWAVVLSADGWLNAISPNFQIAELGRVYQPGLFAGILGLGLRFGLK